MEEDFSNKILNHVVMDATQCSHTFVLKGTKIAECSKCHLGVFINGIKDYDRLVKRINPKA